MRFPFDLPIEWSEEKDRMLVLERGVSFSDVLQALEEGSVLDLIPHWDQKRHPNQFALIIEIKSYAYVVPFVVDTKIFLKTMYPSRRATKKYLTA